ncbi:phosphonate ABC transporter, permease protein PhnE [Aquicoccus sp.]|uniref:phosphonate ABC transporter, permease protein PhnE n=1 Tax=Aquicoccus sp. TaxID=2055851 RepID=UPI003568663B
MQTATTATPADRDTLRRFETAFARRAWRRRIGAIAVVGIILALVIWATGVSDFTTERLARGLPRIGDYIWLTLPELSISDFAANMAYWFYDFPRWLNLLLDTFLIALLATVIGGALAVGLSFVASRNLVDSYALYFVTRRALELFRTVPEIVYGLIFVVAFGIGPLAGLLAITIHTVGALGKLFAEVNENVDPAPMESVRACGGGWFTVMRFAVLPQVLPGFIAYALWRLELNIRAAAIIGFVGAGGIGQQLYTAISMNYYEDISAMVLMIVLTVTLIDLTSERVRHALIGRAAFEKV